MVLPDSVKSARLTAQWEAGLKSVERGEQAPDAFMGGIEQMVSDLVAQYSAVKADTSLFQQREVIGKCPRCGSDVLEGKKNFSAPTGSASFPCGKTTAFHFQAQGTDQTDGGGTLKEWAYQDERSVQREKGRTL